MITLIRHAKVKMEWKKNYTSKEFDAACDLYDHSEIEMPESLSDYDRNSKIYISKLNRTFATASGLFGPEDFCSSSLWNEVPMRSFCDTNKKIPLAFWNVIGRLQWLFNSKRQPESRSMTRNRANRAIDLLESDIKNKSRSCYVVTHGFYIRTLMGEFKKRGYRVEIDNNKVENLQQIRVYSE